MDMDMREEKKIRNKSQSFDLIKEQVCICLERQVKYVTIY